MAVMVEVGVTTMTPIAEQAGRIIPAFFERYWRR
jgi:hypothetical protein